MVQLSCVKDITKKAHQSLLAMSLFTPLLPPAVTFLSGKHLDNFATAAFSDTLQGCPSVAILLVDIHQMVLQDVTDNLAITSLARQVQNGVPTFILGFFVDV